MKPPVPASAYFRHCKNRQNIWITGQVANEFFMQAKEIANIRPWHSSPPATTANHAPIPHDAPLPHVLQALVENRGEPLEIDGMPDSGLIDCAKALTAVSETMPYLPDTSDIELLCTPSEYSASSLARRRRCRRQHTEPAHTARSPGMLRVYLRISHSDPSAAIHSLERYGYIIDKASGPSYADADISARRLSELAHYLNI